MADPVAEKSGFLRMYMSSHPDTLVAYAKFYGQVKENIKSAEMSAIDTKSMTLMCTLANGSKKEVVVVLDPPLKGYEDVKPRLLEMKALTQEGLGMIKAPHITSFRFPLTVNTWFTLFILGCLLYIGTSPSHPKSPLYLPGIHALESLYTLHLCRKHHTGLVVGAQYVFFTLILGFNVWVDLRKRIQAARIESVMKVE
ncbi:uncharacterized protein BT62DRAFT_669993 [Guyanagaster necrorhizus]|uniref:DUF2470 domain-containing protein n=1 Tax=Guyanagaster necrorhizus TaxID=856835 RepID=A0A9P7VYE5_9AGAR|nr:uncharacterized protein BT62DRAFT_669993 [Guyanagaster necrorhizus MCA 3950]KAG7449207.1 hypothetical protein BT62DRAFT_669993 [Guyanagaster necrorhizus MCA 3950]